jgi:hypothetical protein
MTRSQTRVLVVAALTAGGLTGSLSAADAAPKPTVAQVQAQLTQLQHDAEVTTEKYNGVTTKLAAIKVQSTAAATQARLAAGGLMASVGDREARVVASWPRRRSWTPTRPTWPLSRRP